MTNAAKAALLTALILAPAIAQAQTIPPVQSPQDQACRDEAKSRLFSGPTGGQDLFAIGRQYWIACMRRTASANQPVVRKVASKVAKRS